MPQNPATPIPDANEGDAAEQAVPVDRDTSDPTFVVSTDPEAPEADRLEQAQEVPLPDEER